MSSHCYPLITAPTGMGLGDAKTTNSIIGLSTATAATIAPFTGPAAPFILGAAAITGVVASFFQGCGQTCIASTQVANKASEAFNNLSATYFNLPAPRTVSEQNAALAAFDQIQQALEQGCAQVGGQGGKQCIADRIRGGKFDDYILRDRIAADPVIPDPTPTVTSVTGGLIDSITGAGSMLTDISPMLLIGLLVIGGGLMFMGGRK